MIYAGRLEPQKDVLRLAQAFAVAAGQSGLRYQIIGGGSQTPELQEIVTAAGVGNFTLHPHDPDIFARYGAGPVYATLSLHEGTPNALIENIAFGNLIVASRIPEHLDLLGPDYPFYVAPEAGPEAIAGILRSAATARDTGRAPELLAFARARIAPLTPAGIADRYLTLFRELTGR